MTEMPSHGRAATSRVADSSHELLAALLHDAFESRSEDAFRAVCDEAIHRGMLPEMLLILLKRQWRQTPEAHLLAPADGEYALARHVTRCINEYFRPRQQGLS